MAKAKTVVNPKTGRKIKVGSSTYKKMLADGVVGIEENKFTNFTPHEIDLIREDETILKVPPSGKVARILSEKQPKQIMVIDGVRIFSVEKPDFLDGVGDEFMEATHVIVSSFTAEFIAERKLRKNVYAPSMVPSEMVRKDGKIVGVKSLQKYC